MSSSPAVTVPSPKKAKVVKRALASHPPAMTMVVEAVAKLNEKKGSSIQAIKKFVAGFYNVDMVKMAPYVNKALKKQVEAGKLTQTKGTGASGSFKLAAKAKAPAKPKMKKAASPKKKAAATGDKKTKSPKKKTTKPKAPKKAASPKKAKTAKAKPAAAKPKKASPVKKPKTMKAKTPSKPKAAKKAAPKKQ